MGIVYYIIILAVGFVLGLIKNNHLQEELQELKKENKKLRYFLKQYKPKPKK